MGVGRWAGRRGCEGAGESARARDRRDQVRVLWVRVVVLGAGGPGAAHDRHGGVGRASALVRVHGCGSGGMGTCGAATLASAVTEAR